MITRVPGPNSILIAAKNEWEKTTTTVEQGLKNLRSIRLKGGEQHAQVFRNPHSCLVCQPLRNLGAQHKLKCMWNMTGKYPPHRWSAKKIIWGGRLPFWGENHESAARCSFFAVKPFRQRLSWAEILAAKRLTEKGEAAKIYSLWHAPQTLDWCAAPPLL